MIVVELVRDRFGGLNNLHAAGGIRMAANGDGVVLEGKGDDGDAVDGGDGRGQNLLFDVLFHVHCIPGPR